MMGLPLVVGFSEIATTHVSVLERAIAPVPLAVVRLTRLLPEGQPGDVPLDMVIHGADDVGASAGAVRHARRRWPHAWLVCLNVASETAAVTLLAEGADVALGRHTSADLMMATLTAAARRILATNAQLRVAFGDVVYDREARRVWCAGRELTLTPRELQLFDCLFVRAERPVSVDTLQSFVWRQDSSTDTNAPAVYVGYLRRKLSRSRTVVVETLRGYGYRLSRREVRAEGDAPSGVR